MTEKISKIIDRSIDLKPFVSEKDDEMIVCRCEEVTKGQVREAVHAGMYTLQEVRKYLRTGMGLCQGQTCGKLVKKIIAKERGIAPMDLASAVGRAPMRPVEMAVLANEKKEG